MTAWAPPLSQSDIASAFVTVEKFTLIPFWRISVAAVPASVQLYSISGKPHAPLEAVTTANRREHGTIRRAVLSPLDARKLTMAVLPISNLIQVNHERQDPVNRNTYHGLMVAMCPNHGWLNYLTGSAEYA
jgi:hypothetical protein